MKQWSSKFPKQAIQNHSIRCLIQKQRRLAQQTIISFVTYQFKKAFGCSFCSNYDIQAVRYNISILKPINKTMNKRQPSDLVELIEQANLSLLQYLQSSADKIKKQEQQKSQESVKQQTHQVEKEMQQLSIFDKIEDFYIDESLEPKIINLKFTQFTQRRKDELFKRFKKDQEEKLISRKKNAEKNYNLRDSVPKLTKGEFNLRNEILNKTETFPITADDMDKLRPDTDLNDTIVGNYLKLLQFVFLPNEVDQKCNIFSSFFLEKLINQYVKEESIFEKDSSVLVEEIRAKVKENYKNVKRWTKKIDIFEKEILVFPINAFRHWYCILVLRPNSLLTNNPKCQLIFCDSMFEKRDYVIEAIRKYVQYELQEKKNIKIDLNETTAPCYQLLLPRQTNTHDCGLYMLSYIEELLMNSKLLENLSTIKNRRKLNLFPRTLIYTMRERVKNLFTKLINAKQQQKNEILAEYKGERERIINEEKDLSDFDTINEREYKKYEKMNIATVSGATQEEKCFNCEIKFYLDTEINYYEKDK